MIGFATEGLVLLNLMLAARFDAPEIAAIPRETDETVARAWLKFIGYYVTFARAAGPMGALAAALAATAIAYAPPAFSAMMRKAGEAPPGEAPPPDGAADTGLTLQ